MNNSLERVPELLPKRIVSKSAKKNSVLKKFVNSKAVAMRTRSRNSRNSGYDPRTALPRLENRMGVSISSAGSADILAR